MRRRHAQLALLDVGLFGQVTKLGVVRAVLAHNRPRQGKPRANAALRYMAIHDSTAVRPATSRAPESGMKILHAILSQGFYGSERHCIELAAAQARVGHRVAVLIHGGASHCARAFRQEIAATNAAISSGHGAGGARLVVMPHALPAVLHRLFALLTLLWWRPQIVHTHLNPAARRIGRIARRLNIAHVATLHIRYEPREHWDCDGLVCGAAWQRTEIGPEFHGESAVIWAWLPAAVHTALARVTVQEVATLRRAWHADDHTVVLGSIGRLMPEKGMDVLIGAFRAAFPRGDEPARLVMLGIGPAEREDELRRLADGDARITLVGPQPEIAHFYLAFDVYVSASRFEPFGLTILEAMDAGASLVVTRTEGPREFLKDARVLWAEPNDVTSLTAQLRSAVAHGRERQSYDLSPFMQARAVAAVEELYRNVLAKRRLDV
jgi:glycosyltransferase involved in cell wall biosynthesis